MCVSWWRTVRHSGARACDAQPFSPTRDATPATPTLQRRPSVSRHIPSPQQEESSARQCKNTSQLSFFTSGLKARREGWEWVFRSREGESRLPSSADKREASLCQEPLQSWPLRSMICSSSASLLALSSLNHLIFFFI